MSEKIAHDWRVLQAVNGHEFYPQRAVISIGEDARRWNDDYWLPGVFNFYGADICASNLIAWMANGLTSPTVRWVGANWGSNHDYFNAVWVNDFGADIAAWPHYFDPPTNTYIDLRQEKLGLYDVILYAAPVRWYYPALDVWIEWKDSAWGYLNNGGRLWQCLPTNVYSWDYTATVAFAESFGISMKAQSYSGNTDSGHPLPEATTPMTAGPYGNNTALRKLIHSGWWFDDQASMPSTIRMWHWRDAYVSDQNKTEGGGVACYSPNSVF